MTAHCNLCEWTQAQGSQPTRGYVLTAKGQAALDGAPVDGLDAIGFSAEQLTALRDAGYGVLSGVTA